MGVEAKGGKADVVKGVEEAGGDDEKGVMSVSRESMMVMAKRVPKEDEMYKVLKEIARVTMWLRVSVREGVVMKEMVSMGKVSVDVLVMW